MKYRDRYAIGNDPRRITRHDEKLFDVLARYPCLTSEWIAALVDRNPKVIRNRLKELKHGGYVKPADAQISAPNPIEKLVYELAPRGESYLLDRDIPIDKREFSGPLPHRLMSCKVRSSIELGAGDLIRTWSQLIDMGKVPARTLKDDTPHFFPIGSGNGRIRPDTYPFVVEHLTLTPARYFVVGVEVDCGTATIESTDLTSSSIRKKYVRYSSFFRNQMDKEWLGFPRGIVLFTTTSEYRKENLKRHWRTHLKDKPSLSTRIAFTVFKDEPNGWAFTEEWEHADGTKLNLSIP